MDNTSKASRGVATVAAIFEGIIFLISLFGIYTMFNYEILPLKYRLIVTAGLVFINLLLFIFIALGFHRKGFAWTSFVSSFLVLLVAALAVFYLQSGVGTLNTMGIGEAGYTRKTPFSIRVMQDSEIQSIEQLKDVTLSAPYASDQENIDVFYNDFAKENDFDLQVSEAGSYLNGVNMLYNGETEVIIFNEGFLSIISEQYPDFESETRKITEQTVKVQVIEETKKGAVATEAFSVYISGIDTSGPVDTTSRSDVNLIMTVNPNTKKILLLSVPRDSYVAVAGGGNDQMDKLTHAGIYSVESSKQTLANLFGVEIDYWVRVNFTSVINIVDILGGITVNNPTEFTGPGGINFAAGEIDLNGEEALSFSRERYSLEGGDLSRGKNQEIVLKGIINKLSGAEVLSNFTSLLKSVEQSMQTNMSTNEMMRLVNFQLEDGRPWDIVSTSITGYGEMGLPSYAMPGWNLYMFVPDEASVAATKQAMEDVMAGLEPQVTE